MPNSSMFVLPSTIAPARRSRETAVASRGGTNPRRIDEPQVVARPAVARLSFSATGRPVRGPARPASSRRSAASAIPDRNLADSPTTPRGPRRGLDQPAGNGLGAGPGVELTTTYDEVSLAPRLSAQWGLAIGPLRDAALSLSTLYVNNSAGAATGDADFTWVVVRLGLCPLAMGQTTLKLRPCAGVEGGGVRAKGLSAPTGIAQQPIPTVVRPWFAGVALLRLEARAVDGVWLCADAGAAITVTRYAFYFKEGRHERIVREVPRTGGFGAVGLRMGIL